MTLYGYNVETRDEVYESDVECMFADMLDECHDVVNVAGLEYDPSRVLREVDPVAFRCGMLDYWDSLVQDGDYCYDTARECVAESSRGMVGQVQHIFVNILTDDEREAVVDQLDLDVLTFPVALPAADDALDWADAIEAVTNIWWEDGEAYRLNI